MLTDTNKATDVQISQSVDQILNSDEEVVEQPVETPAESVTTDSTPEPTAPVVEGEKTAEPSTGESPKEKLYAGKYLNEYELQAAILEEANALKADKKSLISLFAEAHESKDWSKVEAKYKELQTQVVRQIAEQKKPETKVDETKPEETPSQDSTGTGLSDAEFQEVLMEQSISKFSNTRVAQRMTQLGIEIPKTQEQLDALEVDYPAIFIQFTQMFQNIYRQNYDQALDFLKAEKEAPQHNLTQKQKANAQISEFAQKWNVPIPQEEIDRTINNAIKSGAVLETKNGVDSFIRDGSLFKWFMAERALDMLEQVQNRSESEKKRLEQESLTKGRMQGVEDLENNSKRAIKSISTTDVPPSKPSTVKPINWNDPEDVKKRATEAQIAERLAEALAD